MRGRWMKQRTWPASMLALLMLAPMVPALTGSVPAAPQRDRRPHIAEAPDEGTALRLAREQGTPVVVGELTSETRTVRAEPSGRLTAELSAEPVRVKRDNRWVGVDTALEHRPDGTVSPKATSTELVLSGGGDRTLLRYGREGKRLSLSWPTDLPTPVLSGDAATYPEVFPGTDLVIRAGVTGYTQHLVVRTAQAARNPALRSLPFGVRTEGVKASVGEGGALEVRDPQDDALLFAAPPARMWDSAEQPRHAPVGVDLTAGSMVLRPDPALLGDPAATLPIVIDPAPVHIAKSAWASVYQGEPNSAYWNDSADPANTAQVGYCGWSGCGTLSNARTYFQYDTGWLGGKTYYAAWFNITSVYGPGCTSHDHALYYVDGQITPATTWNNHPPEFEIDRRPVKSNQNCAGNVGVGFDTRGHVRFGGVSTYLLRAVAEGNRDAWRRYDPASAKLMVSYNTKPSAPAEVGTVPQRTACTHCGGRPWIGDDFARLQARLSDPDNDQIQGKWAVSGQPEIVGPMKSSGELALADLDLRQRPDGQVVTWTVRGHDGLEDGPAVEGPSFAVDRSVPASQPGVASVHYPSDNRWHGAIGARGMFEFTSGGVTDIDHYDYGWDSAATNSVPATSLGGNAKVWLAPAGDGPQALHVYGVDRAGRRSPARVHHIYVRAGNGPLAQWSMEGNAEDSAFLGDRDGTLSGGATYSGGPIGTALTLDPATKGHLTAPNTVRTDSSFSVAAWVKLDAGAAARAIVSQDGTNFSGFVLWYRPENGGHWTFGMANSNDVYAGTEMAQDPAPAQIGAWQHLAGVYDAEARLLRLYVNGHLVATAARTVAPWHASGSLRIGRTMWNGSEGVDYVRGSIDEVAVWDRVLTDADVRAVVSRDNVQLGHWRFEDDLRGRTAGNSVPGGASGVLGGGATLIEAGAVGRGVSLNGTDATVTMPGPVVRTDQSYTVSAWVRLDRLAAAGSASTVLSQDGANGSAFYLQQRGTNWMFGMFTADGSGAWAGYADTEAGSAVAGTGWVHLAAVYDATQKQARIYLNGVQGRSGAVSNVWHANGSFVVGRGRFGGGPVDFFPGGVDEVRAYSRVLDTAEIRGIIGQNNVTGGHWRLDGDLTDSSGRGLHGTSANNPDFTGGQTSHPDPADLALRLGGGHVSAPHALNTTGSYSVSAWARLDRTGSASAVVSQDGNRVSAFNLYASADGKWSFVTYGSDVDGGGGTALHYRLTGPDVQPGVWTHLSAVYDAVARQHHLYVNGVLAASRSAGAGWDHQAGQLQIGAAKWNGSRTEPFHGAIDDVTVHNRVLFAEEIRVMAGRDLSLVHHWALDEGSGATTADSVGSRTATVDGAARVAGKSANALRLGGDGDTATTSGIDLRTDGGFTVSAWVRLESMDCADPYEGCRRDAVSLDGSATGSKFRLGHIVDDGEHQSGSWIFELPEPDGTTTKAAVYAEPRDLRRWVHLAGVYDAAAGAIWIYVDGTRQGEGTLNTAWQHSGGLAIGRGRAGGDPAAFWHGDVDDVRLYTGAFGRERVSALFRSYPDGAAPVGVPMDVVGYWKFDEGSGTAAADSSASGRHATLQNGAGWVGGRKGWSGRFDSGATAFAATAGPVLNTAASFSVSAWAYLSDTSANRTVVAQDSDRVSAFSLQFRADSRRWTAVAPVTDRDEPGAVLLASAEAAATGEWTHLALVHDQGTQQLRLYVNGLLSTVRTGVVPITGSGALTIGRGKWNGESTGFFKTAIDEVRAYARPLSDAEVRAVHDEAPSARHGSWRFDDSTVRDSTWRANPTTATGGVGFVPGVSGKAVQFDGTGYAAAQFLGASMRDSFTVAAWARLDRTDRIATVAGQDGSRNSGFFLQYRPGPQRWVFGAPAQDADASPVVYAASARPAVAGQWTHLAGVYDYPAKELRLYVDGQLTATKAGVGLWIGNGGFTVGRGKEAGQPAHLFTGAIDEVGVYAGRASAAEIAQWAGHPAPLGGGLGLYANTSGDRYLGATAQAPRDGYRFLSTLGSPVKLELPGTHRLYQCVDGTDRYASATADCTVEAEIGRVFTEPQAEPPTLPIYRCHTETDRFESLNADCGGAVNDGVLGHAQAYAPSFRYLGKHGDHWTDVNAGPPGSRNEGPNGFLALTAQPGTTPLHGCLDAFYDQFVSTDPACEGKQILGVIGHLWAQPPAERDTKPIYLCRINGERFVSFQSTCDGWTVVGRIGYVLSAPPA